MEIEELNTKIELMMKLQQSINVKLEKLLNQKIVSESKEIVKGLKAEEDGEKEGIRPTELVGVNGVGADLHTDSKPSEILMDLKDVTIIAQTEKALLVSKKGLQKWVPKSTILGVFFQEFSDGKTLLTDLKVLSIGNYLNEIELENSGQWIDTKPWEKLELRKGGKG